MKIYTKTGDQGQTSLVDGSRVSKSHPRVEAYGSLDELNSQLGLLIFHLKKDSCLGPSDISFVESLQPLLFQMGSQLACENPKVSNELPSVSLEEIEKLEEWMDKTQNSLPVLKNFILPGGHLSSSLAHICRSLCRRCERLCVQLHEKTPLPQHLLIFLNRLSDTFFVLARHINNNNKISDIQWIP